VEFTPKHGSDKFKCPHCHIISQQHWFNGSRINAVITSIFQHIYLDYRTHIQDYKQKAIAEFLEHANEKLPRELSSLLPPTISVAVCQSCNKFSIWVSNKMEYPKIIPVDPPNEDLNEEIKSLYNEASKIIADSPKGATALLRLALQKLLKQIGKEGKNINNDIKDLVEHGLSPKIQKALDLLRVDGNNAVHPGEINLDDNSEIALKLFKILNIIADELITKPKEIDTLYKDIVPDETKGHIDQRDGRAKK
jgi:hypothetical protein